MQRNETKGFTLIELLVVVLILGLLSTIAVGVFTTQVERARIASAKSTIQELSLAIERYQIDLGAYPPSGSLSNPSGVVAEGCGYLQLCLMHSMSGDSKSTSGTLWRGPYLNLNREQLGDFSGNPLEELTAAPDRRNVQILDPWRTPYRYVRSGPNPDDYDANAATLLPSNHPFAATEKYYNPSTFQIVSKGHDGETPNPPNYGMGGDDVTNFGM